MPATRCASLRGRRFRFTASSSRTSRRRWARIDASLLTTIAACGDVNRNVICNPNPHQSPAHAAALDTARAISDHLLPRTPAYREIWLDGERIAGGEPAQIIETIYGATSRPRKFKVAAA